MERKFNVGDRVRINRWGIENADHLSYAHHDLIEGMTGEVVVANRYDVRVWVRWDAPRKSEETVVYEQALDAVPRQRFSIGDKVVLNEKAVAHVRGFRTVKISDIVVGTVGEVVRHARPTDEYCVRLEGVESSVVRGDGGWWFKNDWLEAYVEPPKHRFAVGDKVRVARLTPLSWPQKRDYVGKEGVVTAIYPGFPAYPYVIEINGKANYGWSDDELEPSKWSTDVSSFARIDDATIERWAANREVEGSTINSGDALVMRSCGRTYVYRLERYSDER